MPYWAALALTLAIEAPICVVWLTVGAGLTPVRALVVGIGVNLATHPIVWFVLPPLLVPPLGWLAYATIAEAFAWGVEAALILAWRRRNPVSIVVLSALANAASYTIGVLIQQGA